MFHVNWIYNYIHQTSWSIIIIIDAQSCNWCKFVFVNLDLKYQQIDVLNQRVVLFEERLKVVEPKWYENRYLWFFMGIAITVTAVDLAGQID